MVVACSALAILLHRSTVLLLGCHSTIASRSRSIIECLDVCSPLVCVRSEHAAVVRQQSVDLALDVGGLGPDAARASILLYLVAKFGEEEM